MKKLLMLALGAVLALATPFAHADSLNQISFAGSDTVATADGLTTVTYAPQGMYGNATVFGNSTGIFSAFTGLNPPISFGTVVNFTSFNSSQTGFVLFSATAPNGQKVSFTVSSITPTSDMAGPGLTGTGYYTFVTNGVTTTVAGGTFQMSTQTGTGISFSDTNTVTPEPSSLVLLGTGLVSAAGMLVRRRRRVVA